MTEARRNLFRRAVRMLPGDAATLARALRLPVDEVRALQESPERASPAVRLSVGVALHLESARAGRANVETLTTIADCVVHEALELFGMMIATKARASIAAGDDHTVWQIIAEVLAGEVGPDVFDDLQRAVRAAAGAPE